MSTRSINDALRITFDTILAAILTSKMAGCPSETGLDFETIDALNAAAATVRTNGDVADAVNTAHNELSRMFDGTHAREYWLTQQT